MKATKDDGSARLQGKAAIITGGGAGIGRAISILFAREKARVAVADIDLSAARATAAAVLSSPGASSSRTEVTRLSNFGFIRLHQGERKWQKI